MLLEFEPVKRSVVVFMHVKEFFMAENRPIDGEELFLSGF